MRISKSLTIFAVGILASVVFVPALGGCSGGSGSSTETAQGAATLGDAGDGEGGFDGGDLTADQAKLILNSIDDHCGDAWCEGDFDFDFKAITCTFSKGTCSLDMVLTGDDGTKSFPESCEMTAVTGYDQMIEKFANGFQDMTDGFFEKVDACITSAEDKVPKP